MMHTSLKDINTVIDNLFEENIIRYVLPNGLTVLLKPDHTSALVSAQVWVKTGSIHENKYLGSGMSHFVEHMLFKGTKKRSFQDISTAIHASGGQINAYTTFDRTVYYVDTISESLEVTLDILSDIVFESTFCEEEINRERDVILREIDMYQDDPDQLLGQGLFATAFKTHPYQYPIIGFKESFLHLNKEILYKYYQERYVPNNMVVVVAGDIHTETIILIIEQLFGKYPRQLLAPIWIPNEIPQLALRQHRLYGDYHLVRCSMAFKIPLLSHPDSPALDILASLLGYGQSSILWQRLREELKLVYDIDAQTWHPGSEGLLCISYTCDTDKRAQVEAAILDEIDNTIHRGIPYTLLQKSVRQTIVSEINARKTISGQASRLGGAEVIVGDLDYPKVYLKKISTISSIDIEQVLKKYLHTSSLTMLSLEPNENKANNLSNIPIPASHQLFSLHTLPNGTRISLQPSKHFPKVNIRIAMLGGPLYEVPNQKGITGLLATLMTKDTKKRTALEVAQSIEDVGGYFGEFAGNNSFGLSLEVLSEDLSLGLELLFEGLLHPVFKQATLDSERDHQIAQIKEEEDDITEYGKRILRERFFGEHPYAHSALGTIQALQQMTLSDIQAHWSHLVCGSNLVITASGCFDETQLLDKLKIYLADLPQGPFQPLHYPCTQSSHPGYHETFLDREQAVIFQAYTDCGAQHPDYEIGSIIDEILNGLSSPLFTKVREQKGMAYFVGSSRVTGVNTGMFYLYAGTHTEQVKPVLNEMQSEIKRIKQAKITPEELLRCKIRLKAKKRMNLQAPGARAAEAAFNVLYGHSANDWATYNQRIDAITLDDIQRFANHYFSDQQLTQLVIKPKKTSE